MECTHTHTHTHTFNGPLSGTTRVSRYQKGKNNLDFTEARDSEWQWHQLGHMQVCTSLQADNHASNPTAQFFTGRMPFLPPNQQRQSIEGTTKRNIPKNKPIVDIRLRPRPYGTRAAPGESLSRVTFAWPDGMTSPRKLEIRNVFHSVMRKPGNALYRLAVNIS